MARPPVIDYATPQPRRRPLYGMHFCAAWNLLPGLLLVFVASVNLGHADVGSALVIFGIAAIPVIAGWVHLRHCREEWSTLLYAQFATFVFPVGLTILVVAAPPAPEFGDWIAWLIAGLFVWASLPLAYLVRPEVRYAHRLRQQQ